eukprot:EG_transcript_19787
MTAAWAGPSPRLRPAPWPSPSPWLAVVVLLCLLPTPRGGPDPFWGLPLSGPAVTAASSPLRVFVYPPPPRLHRALGLGRRATRGYLRLEAELLRGLQANHPHQFTADPATADFFWVPHALVAHWIDTPNLPVALWGYWTRALRPWLLHLTTAWPYFNRSGGRDHVFVYSMDQGPLCEEDWGAELLQRDPAFRRLVHPMIHVGYHGVVAPPLPQTPGRPRPTATPRVCFRPGHDIVVPQWHDFHLNHREEWSVQLLQRIARTAVGDVFFQGQVVEGHCSPGVRRRVREYCADRPLPSRVTAAARCSGADTCTSTGMGSAVFSLAPAGEACWSLR